MFKLHIQLRLSCSFWNNRMVGEQPLGMGASAEEMLQVFTPLTRLCRDACGYCTFAQPPVPGRRSYMTMEEVLQVASMGVQQGCAEILFTLGKPSCFYCGSASLTCNCIIPVHRA